MDNRPNQKLQNWTKTGLLVCFCMLMIGCGDARMQRLCGSWKLDLPKSESLVDNLFDGQSPDEDGSFAEKLVSEAGKAVIKKSLDQAKNTLSQSMNLQFRSDGTWTSRTEFAIASGKKSGNWSVVSEEGDTVKIRFDWKDPKSGQVESGETEVTFVEQDLIRLVPPNISSTEMELTFRRENGK